MLMLSTDNTLTFTIKYSPIEIADRVHGPFYACCTIAGYKNNEYFYLTTDGRIVNRRVLPKDEIWFESLNDIRHTAAINGHMVEV